MVPSYSPTAYADYVFYYLVDPDAIELARRLDGLPLALAMAGTYLRQVSDSFSEYLRPYDNSWDDLGQYNDGLVDYDGRTLYSTSRPSGSGAVTTKISGTNYSKPELITNHRGGWRW